MVIEPGHVSWVGEPEQHGCEDEAAAGRGTRAALGTSGATWHYLAAGNLIRIQELT